MVAHVRSRGDAASRGWRNAVWMVAVSLAWALPAMGAPDGGGNGVSGAASEGASEGAQALEQQVAVALLDLHVPATRVSGARIRAMTRRMETVLDTHLDGARCRLIPVHEVEARTTVAQRTTCLTADCMMEVGQALGATYLVKGIVASVSGGVLVRVDVRDGLTGAVVASRSLVVSRQRDLVPVSEWLVMEVLSRSPGTGVLAEEVPRPPRRVQAFASLKELRRVRYVPPEYPGRARRRNLEGVVMVEVSCTASGRVKQVRWLSGDRVFRRSVKRAVRRWAFEPQPVDFRFRQPLWFRLESPGVEEQVTRANVNARSSTGEDGGTDPLTP